MSWWEQGLRLLLAVFIGCVIGIERERKNRPAGMRTHVLVCVGASIIAIMESLMIADTITLNMNNASTGIAISYGRISAQVISGIGFLGAGTIFISQKKIAGLTTAASLWNVACLGLAVGMGYYTISIAGCAIVIITLSLLQRLVRVNSVKHVEIKFIHRIFRPLACVCWILTFTWRTRENTICILTSIPWICREKPLTRTS